MRLGELYTSIGDDPQVKADKPPDGWVANHLLNPFINGSGLIQLSNNLRDKPAELLPVVEDTSRLGWVVQTAASAAGAIIPYALAARFTHTVFRSAGSAAELHGLSARIVSSEGLSQVVGAGLYDFAKKPDEQRGETRLSNMSGSVFGFSTFMGGNHLLNQVTPGFSNGVIRFATNAFGKYMIGTLGGGVSFDASSAVAKWQGVNDGLSDEARAERRKSAMAGAGFINLALPYTHTVLSYAAKNMGFGVPIQRHLDSNNIADPEMKAMARWNPLANVKVSSGPEASIHARLDTNTIMLKEGSTHGDLAEEMAHLYVAHRSKSGFTVIREIAQKNPAEAEQKFTTLRQNMEAEAQAVNRRVQERAGQSAPDEPVDISNIGDRIAGNGKTYKENWAAEWQLFRRSPSSMPQVEYAEQAPQPAKPETPATGLPDTSRNSINAATAISPDIGADKTHGASTASLADRPQGSDNTSVTDKPKVPDKAIADQKVVGTPELGAKWSEAGVNFGLFSSKATGVDLLLFDKPGDTKERVSLPLFRTGDVWHRFVPDLPDRAPYLYRVHGAYTPEANGDRFNANKVLLDPRAKAITGETVERTAFGYDASDSSDPNRHLKPSDVDNVKDAPKGLVIRDNFDWQGDKPLNIPMQDTVIAEMNLPGFTAGDDTLGALRATYRGFLNKIPHWRDTLGLKVNAVQLMPIFEFDKDHWPHYDPISGKKLGDSWGYNTVGYFAPEGRFAADGQHGQQVNEFKEMVREMHKNGVQVYLDVVYNHTREGNELGPTLNFRGIDNSSYYLLDPEHPEKYVDHTGVGNTLNSNNPAVTKMIVDSLRYWVDEMHVDRFRFDLATVFKFDVDGSYKFKTDVMKALEEDPVLSTRLIAEPWGTDSYALGNFSDKAWSEWNGSYRDTVRKFIRGDDNQVGSLAERIAGSPKWFDQSTGRHSVNFVTAHDGFTLYDLVSYNDKHNDFNGEGNRDGSSDNFSSNGGIEGPVRFDLKRALQRTMNIFESYPAIKSATMHRANGTQLEVAQSYVRNDKTEMTNAPGQTGVHPLLRILPSAGIGDVQAEQQVSPDQKPNEARTPNQAVPDQQVPSNPKSAPSSEPVKAETHGSDAASMVGQELPTFKFSIPMRVSYDHPGMGLLTVETSGKLPDHYAEMIQSVARQGAHAMEIAKDVEAIPQDKRTAVEQYRKQQMKNFWSILMLSRGTPMFLVGDEAGRTQYGNNNAWCQEMLNIYDWDLTETNKDMVNFTGKMIDLRNQFQIGRTAPDDFTWHGTKPMQPDWGASSHFLAWEVKPTTPDGKRLYTAFNTWDKPLEVTLPSGKWSRRVDTNMPAGQDIVDRDHELHLHEGSTYVVQPHTAVVLEAD